MNNKDLEEYLEHREEFEREINKIIEDPNALSHLPSIPIKVFYSLLKSKHMKILSISNKEYKDFAMMLIMRNGNVLISQGIEISKWINVNQKEIYEICKTAMKELMDYMNSSGDNIVATIIGASNNNVTNYNSNILPFIVNPILKNDSSFYTGIDNYQCLLDLVNNKSINDIKLYEPSKMYKDNTDIFENLNLKIFFINQLNH